FRYIETWNDQVYPCSAVDYQEMFWSSLLAMERKPGTPTWVTTPTAPQPGTFMRRSLSSIARGATGIGYACEGGAGLTGDEGGGPWGANPSRANPRTAEVMLGGDMAAR